MGTSDAEDDLLGFHERDNAKQDEMANKHPEFNCQPSPAWPAKDLSMLGNKICIKCQSFGGIMYSGIFL